MNYVNRPDQTPAFVTHHTLYSQSLGRDVGYNIYLPPDYDTSGERYPVTYHLHGYQGNESSDIWALEKIYKARRAITVFVNAIPEGDGYTGEVLPFERHITTELVPYIDGRYPTVAAREGRSLTGWSMGGGGAFYCAVRYLELFCSVTAYAGTYHHFYHSDYDGVGEPLEKAAELYESMRHDDRCFDSANVLKLRQNADAIRGGLHIALQVGTIDPLICDNEVMHLYLESLNIPHEYKTVAGVAHDLGELI